jgi:hypothetical protein
MPRMLALYSVTYVDFMSNKQLPKNMRLSLLFIEKSKKYPIIW